MIGPYWLFFTRPEPMFKKFKELGANQLFTESFNTIGGNWAGVEKVLRKYYPQLLKEMAKIFFSQKDFENFYGNQGKNPGEFV